MNELAPAMRPRSSLGSKKRNVRVPSQCAPGLPGAGPALAPTARRLLEAARQLLIRSGYQSLTAEAIGREAGVQKSLINYYFGSKQGLLMTLIDWLVSDTLWQTRRRLSATVDEGDPSRLVAGTTEAMLDDPQSYRLFFDLLPRLLEEPTMVTRLTELYRAYRDMNVRALWADRSESPPELVKDLAAMTLALADGLAVQVLAEPGSVDVPRALATWALLMDHALASMPGADEAAGDSSRES